MKIVEVLFGSLKDYSYISSVRLSDMTIKEFYLEKYPTDELGEELNEKATFVGLVTELFARNDVYDYIGVGDSLIRERLFTELANQLNKPYDYVYNMWMEGVDYRNPIHLTI